MKDTSREKCLKNSLERSIANTQTFLSVFYLIALYFYLHFFSLYILNTRHKLVRGHILLLQHYFTTQTKIKATYGPEVCI